MWEKWFRKIFLAKCWQTLGHLHEIIQIYITRKMRGGTEPKSRKNLSLLFLFRNKQYIMSFPFSNIIWSTCIHGCRKLNERAGRTLFNFLGQFYRWDLQTSVLQMGWGQVQGTISPLKANLSLESFVLFSRNKRLTRKLALAVTLA